MQRLRQIFRQPALLIGFSAVIIPLAVMLFFQYRWLVSLERASVVAQEATLQNYLEALTSEVRYAYAGNAERGLNLPAELFTGTPSLEKVAQHLRKREIWGARWLFIVFVFDNEPAEVVFFDPECSCWGEPADDRTLQAVHVASAPWVMLGLRRAAVETIELQVDEKDPEVRMILNPITDERRRVVGVAGMILEAAYFQNTLLPMAIDKSLPSFFDEDAGDHLLVNVQDASGTTVYRSDQTRTDQVALGEVPAARRTFNFVFADWAVELGSDRLSAKEWARGNFMLNLSLSALLGIALLGGTVFTLRTASREVRLSRMKSDFVDNVSHELRTPLSSIRAFGEFLRLRRVEDLEKAAEYGEYIETESRRLSQLINNILDFSKIESGQRTYRRDRIDLSELLFESLETFRIRAEQTGFEVDYQDLSSGEVDVVADGPALVQAVSNLLDNAVKYSGDQHRIQVRLETGSSFAVLSIRDFGVGISRVEQEKVFERFHRVSTGLIHEVRGSGLGLSIVHHIVTAHGGTVTVSSEPGRGSTFFVRLPLAEFQQENGVSS